MIGPSTRRSAGPTHHAGRHAAQNRADAQHELLRAERLREVVVGAECESSNAVRLFAPRGEHEHRDVARRRGVAQLLEHVVARRARQHEVEHDERGPFLSRGRQRVGSGGGSGNPIARFDEMVRDQRDDVRLIVDDENALAGDWNGSRGHGAALRALAEPARRR